MSKPKKKRKYVHHRKECTCNFVDMGYNIVYQVTVQSDCPFHKHLIKEE